MDIYDISWKYLWFGDISKSYLQSSLELEYLSADPCWMHFGFFCYIKPLFLLYIYALDFKQLIRTIE